MLERESKTEEANKTFKPVHKTHKCELKIRELKGSKVLRKAVGGFSAKQGHFGTQACFGSWIR